MDVSTGLFSSAPTLSARGIALAKFALFVALFIGCYALGFPLLQKISGAHLTDGVQPTSLRELIIIQYLFVLVVAVPVIANLVIWREPLHATGFARTRHAPLLFAIGAVAGLILMAALILVLHVAGFVALAAQPTSVDQALGHGAAFLLIFVGAALAEQSLMRGFPLVQLSRAISFWPAALVLSSLFGLMHLGNSAESSFGVITAALFGLVCAYSFRATGSLWFAVGLHMMWDFAETFLFGVPNSGRIAPGALMTAKISGDPLLSGGSAGPEGSAFAILPLLAMFAVARAAARRATSSAS